VAATVLQIYSAFFITGRDDRRTTPTAYIAQGKLDRPEKTTRTRYLLRWTAALYNYGGGLDWWSTLATTNDHDGRPARLSISITQWSSKPLVSGLWSLVCWMHNRCCMIHGTG
jgi:hypothetical protein